MRLQPRLIAWAICMAGVFSLAQHVIGPAPSLAANSSSYCEGYARDYATQASRGSGRGALGGAARGAAGGALFGAIAGDAGKGAAIGAGVGAIAGGARRANNYDAFYRQAYDDCMRG